MVDLATMGKFSSSVHIGGGILYQRRDDEKYRLNIKVQPLKLSNKFISANFLKIENKSPSFKVSLKE